MLNFKTIEPSTQIALLVNPKKHPNFPKTDLDDAVDNAVSDFWKELEELENGKDHRCLLYTSPSPRDKRQSRMPSSA